MLDMLLLPFLIFSIALHEFISLFRTICLLPRGLLKIFSRFFSCGASVLIMSLSYFACLKMSWLLSPFLKWTMLFHSVPEDATPLSACLHCFCRKSAVVFVLVFLPVTSFFVVVLLFFFLFLTSLRFPFHY